MTMRKIGEATVGADGYARLNYIVQERNDFYVTATYNDDFSATKLIEYNSYMLDVWSEALNIYYGDTTYFDIDLTNGSKSVEGKIVNYVISNNNGTISSGTVTLNASGTARIPYTGRGRGRVTCTATFRGLTSSDYINDLNDYSLTLTQTGASLRKGEVNSIYGTITNNGHTIPGVQMDFYFAHGGIIIKSAGATTNSQGVGTAEYTCTGVGDVTCTVSSIGITETISFRDKDTYTINITVPKTTYYNDEAINVTGTVTNATESVSGITLDRRVNYVNDDTVTTNANGQFTDSFTLSSGTKTLQYGYNGLDYSNTKTLSIQDHTYNVSLSTDKSTATSNESVTLSGTVLEDGAPVANGLVALYDGDSLVTTVRTNANGNYSYQSTYSIGTHTFKAKYGSTYSNTVRVTVSQGDNYAMAYTLSKDRMGSGEQNTMSVTLTNNGVPARSQSVSWQVKQGNTVIDTATTTTNSNGKTSKTYTGAGRGRNMSMIATSHSISKTATWEDYNHYVDSIASWTDEGITPGYKFSPFYVPLYDKEGGVDFYFQFSDDEDAVEFALCDNWGDELWGVGIGWGVDEIYWRNENETKSSIDTSIPVSTSSLYHITYNPLNHTLKIFVDDVLKYQTTGAYDPWGVDEHIRIYGDSPTWIGTLE